MDKTIIINGVEILAYVAGYSVCLRLTKDGQVKLDSPVGALNLAKIIRPETLPTVRALIAEVEAGSATEIEAALAARRAEIDAEEAEYQTRTDNYAAYQYGKTPVCSDAMARAMSVQG